MRSRNQRSRNEYGSRSQYNRNQGNRSNRNRNYDNRASGEAKSNYGGSHIDEYYNEKFENRRRSYKPDVEEYNSEYRGNNFNSRKFFEPYGEWGRDTLNDWTDRNTEANYSNQRHPRRRYGNGNGRDRGESIYNRAGRRIRETWDDWTDRDDYDNRRYNDSYDPESYYGRDYGYSEVKNIRNRGGRSNEMRGERAWDLDYRQNQRNPVNQNFNPARWSRRRNALNRAANKIKVTWNDWTHGGNDGDYGHRSEGRNRYSDTHGYSNRNYRHNWKNRKRHQSNW